MIGNHSSVFSNVLSAYRAYNSSKCPLNQAGQYPQQGSLIQKASARQSYVDLYNMWQRILVAWQVTLVKTMLS